MSRSLKLSLWIGIPVICLLLISTALFLSSRRLDVASSADYDDVLGVTGIGSGGDFSAGVAYGGSVRPSAPQEPAKRTVAEASDHAYNATQPTTDAPTQERLIIKTGNMSVIVSDVPDAMKQVADYAVKKGGFVVSSNVYKSGIAPYGEVTVRVPANTFDESVDNIKKMGEVTSQRTSGQDVTEEYVDLDAQLKNLRATENQFLEIMKKADKITDILAVQNELSTVRGRIESIQGQMKYLKQSSDLSTLTVYLSTDPGSLPTFDDSETWKPLAVVKSAFRTLLEVGKGLVGVLIWFFVFIPLWLGITLMVWIIVKVVKRARRKQASNIDRM